MKSLRYQLKNDTRLVSEYRSYVAAQQAAKRYCTAHTKVSIYDTQTKLSFRIQARI